MAQARDKFDDDSDSSDDLGIYNMPMPLAAHLGTCYYPDPTHPRPVFPPPPTAAVAAPRIQRKKVPRPKPEPLSSLPPVPPIPPLATEAPSSVIPDMPKTAVATTPGKARRKTLTA